MFSQLAQVFSSQGVLVQGTRYASGANKKKNTEGLAEGEGGKDVFKALFDQAASKLELSQSGIEKNTAKVEAKPSVKPANENDSAVKTGAEYTSTQNVPPKNPATEAPVEKYSPPQNNSTQNGYQKNLEASNRIVQTQSRSLNIFA